MPRGDRTGPSGMGQMTGRGAGYCAGFVTHGYANSVGNGYSLGGSCGFRRMFHKAGFPRCGQNINGEYSISEKELLKKQANFLESQLAGVKKHLVSFEDNAE